MNIMSEKISNMSFINKDGTSTVVLYKTKNQFDMKCSWVLVNVPNKEEDHRVTIQIENSENKVIYEGNSVARINSSLKEIPQFNYQGNKAFNFITEVHLDESNLIWDELKNEKIYKVNLFIDSNLHDISSSYFLLKEVN